MGYMLGGLDWTNTFLGRAFKAQEQVLFFFAAIIFVVSVTLHLFSIKEHPYNPHQQDTLDAEDADSSSSLHLNGTLPRTRLIPQLDFISEEEPFEISEDDQSVRQVQMDFRNVRSKSDSVLALPDATIELDPDLAIDLDVLFVNDMEPTVFQDFQANRESEGPFDHCHCSTCDTSQCSGLPGHQVSPCREECLFATTKAINGDPAGTSNLATAIVGTLGHQNKAGGRHPNHSTTVRCRHPSFYRQPSFTFSYHGRVGFLRARRRANTAHPMKSSRSLNDIDALARRHERRKQQQSGSASSGPDEEDGESEEGESGTTVKLLWLSMLKMPPQLWRLCVCHLLTWFSIIAQAVFYTDFMGQVIYEGDPMVRRVLHTGFHQVLHNSALHCTLSFSHRRL